MAVLSNPAVERLVEEEEEEALAITEEEDPIAALFLLATD